jgi:hypothetical protein
MSDEEDKLEDEKPFWTKEHGRHREQLQKALFADDDLGAVVRAQVVVEYYLQGAIEAALYNKDAIRSRAWKDDLTFTVRVQLFQALGAKADANKVKALRKLSEIRNKLAHNIASEVAEQDAKDFIGALTEHQRDAIVKQRQPRDTWKNDFRAALFFHVVDVQIETAVLRNRYDTLRPAIAKGLKELPFADISELEP